ncbi:hypothetical protein MKX03_006624 [Papaver bracteatum]|nr:hypothetical protein MKX03_006624 [Papaver bracteatum]
MSQTKKQHSKNKIGSSDRASIPPGQLRSNYGSVKNRGGRASQLGRHTMDDLVEPPLRSGKSRRGSLLQQVGRRQQQPMNEQPSSQIEEHEQVEEEYLQQPEERSGRTRSTTLPTRSPPRRGRGGRSLPITPSRLPLNDDNFLDSPRRSPRGLVSNRVVTSRSDDFINSLRRSPRGLSNNRVQRSLDPEYNASNAGQIPRHHQVQHQSNQLYNTQVSSSSRQQPLGLQHQSSRSSSSQRHCQTPSNDAPLGNRNILQQNPSRSELQQNDNPEDQHLSRKHPSRSASNSPQSNEVCGTAETRGNCTIKEKERAQLYEGTCQIQGKKILELDLHGGRLCGYKHKVAINSVCMWTRQCQNCPLKYEEFDDIPPEKIQRVINKLHDYFRIKSRTGEDPELAIKKIMRNAYNRHTHKIHKAYLKLGGHEVALAAEPPTELEIAKEDWVYMCETFATPEFKKKSDRGTAAAKAKEIYHSAGNNSFASVEYDLIAENKPYDAVILFSETHGSKKLPPKCQEMKKTMEDMKEATLRGESSKTPADIYETVYNEQRGGLNKRRHKDSHTHKSLDDLREKEIQLLNERIESLQTENMLQRRQTCRLTDLMNSFFSKHYPSMVVPYVSYDEMEDDVEVCGRDDEDLDVEDQNDEDDYDDTEDNFICDYPDMEHRNVEGAGDDE